jgi:hypothetical protein
MRSDAHMIAGTAAGMCRELCKKKNKITSARTQSEATRSFLCFI